MRHLDDEDLDAISVLLEATILAKLTETETRIMATLDDAIAADQALKGEVDQIVALVGTLNTTVATLQSEIAAGGDPTKVAQLVSDLGAQSAEITAALPTPAPAPAPAVFVAKVDGETFDSYVARVAAWNADPANAPITAVDQATWDALPVG